MKITKLYPPKNNAFVLDDLPFRSQTLFGALANCFVELFGQDSFPDFLALFDEGSIGSIFPAISIEGKEIFFLPTPYLSRFKDNADKEDSLSKKKIKNLRWLSVEAMKFLSNSIIKRGEDYYHSVDFTDDFLIIGNEFLIMKNELSDSVMNKLKNISFYQKNSTIRVSVARFGEDSTPFDQAEISFTDMKIDSQITFKTFLYFPENIENNSRINAAKQLLAEVGIGGKRNLGKGYFEKIEADEILWEKPTEPKLYLLLSNLIPNKEELQNILYYETGIEDGFITFGYASSFKKDAVYYLKEGSVMKAEIKGKIIPQTYLDKKVYRYGKAFLFPLGGSNG